MKRRRSSLALRVTSGVATAGVIAGASFFAAAPAAAMADCLPANTVDSATGSAADIQALLDASAPVVCLTGSFVLTAPLDVTASTTVLGLGSGATLDGGAATPLLEMNWSDSWTIENLRLTGAVDNAVYSSGPLTVRDSTFEGNTGSYGAAIYADGELTVSGSAFRDNVVSDQGGAVFARQFLEVTTSTFEGNEAGNLGGAIFGYGSIDIASSTFDDNTGVNGGGAAYARDDLAVVNSTFFGNTSDDAALSMEGGSVMSSTFLDNTSAVSSNVAPTFVGNIFALTGVQVRQLEWFSGEPAVDGGGNLFTSSAATEDVFTPPSASSRFDQTVADIFTTGLLADNGGPTPTLALNPTGPAIGAVPAGAALIDQRGVSRPTPADAGSFQYVAPVVPETPAVAPAATAPARLPDTGFGGTGFLALAGGLLAAGGLLFAGSRRQMRRSTTRS